MEYTEEMFGVKKKTARRSAGCGELRRKVDGDGFIHVEIGLHFPRFGKLALSIADNLFLVGGVVANYKWVSVELTGQKN